MKGLDTNILVRFYAQDDLEQGVSLTNTRSRCLNAMQSFSDTLGQVFRAILANKLRSFLTMFGIAWGVGSLLVLVGLGEGFRSGQHKQMSTWATTW
jgi:hypothetical protein